MRASNQFYLEQYGFAPQTPIQPQGPFYDTSTLDYESMVGGEFGFGSENPVYAQANPNYDLASLQGGQANVAVPSQEALLGELDGMMAEEPASPPVDLLSLLEDLKEELKKPENKAVLSEEQIDGFEEQISDFSKMAGKPEANVEELLAAIEELKETLAAALEEATASHQEQVQSAKASVEGLLDKVEKSKLSSEQKEGFKSRLESLQGDLGENEVDVAEVREKLVELNKEIGREIYVEDLKRKLDTLPSKIPSEGWHKEQTLELANMLVSAIRDGDWGRIKTYLIDKRDNHKNEGNNFIPQLIGTIFMDLAGSDEDKLDQFLALIPSDIRDLMASAATQEDVNSTEHLDNALKYKYYGRPSATAERLRNSRIDEALEQIETEALPE